MGERLTKDYERAIREALASCRGEGRSWSWGNAGPFATVDETAEALAQVARNADGDGGAATNLWCVHMPDPNEPGMSLYVCHTGNGPTSQAHARFFAGAPNAIRMLLAEIDALRAAPPTTYLHADGTEEPIGELVARLTRERDAHAARNRGATQAIVDAIGSVGPESVEDAAQRIVARVRELEAERDDARERFRAHVEHGPVVMKVSDDSVLFIDAVRERDQAKADLAETRAQLARLREAASGLLSSARDAIVASWDARLDDRDRGGVVIDRAAYARLAASVKLHVDAISTPGPTLAEMQRAAQVEVLRELAKEMAPPAAPTMGSATWDAWRERIARQFGTFDAVAIHDWLRQRADDLEAGRG